MKNVLLLALFNVLFLFGCKKSTTSQKVEPPILIPTPKAKPMITPTPAVKKVVFYDFWAPWCGPCRAFGPTFDAWKKQYSNDHTEFKKVNLDESRDLAVKFNISSIPTVIVTVDGVEAKRWVGAPLESDIKEYLK